MGCQQHEDNTDGDPPTPLGDTPAQNKRNDEQQSRHARTRVGAPTGVIVDPPGGEGAENEIKRTTKADHDDNRPQQRVIRLQEPQHQVNDDEIVCTAYPTND